MTQRDWLLLLIAFKGSPDGLDPIRVQKGMFLLSEEGGLPPDQRYEFIPYNYGPMSKQVYRDLDRLEAEGLIEREDVPGYEWRRIKSTAAGLDRAKSILGDARRESLDATKKLFETKQEIVSRDFSGLLDYVYTRYPQYATASVFRRG